MVNNEDANQINNPTILKLIIAVAMESRLEFKKSSEDRESFNELRLEFKKLSSKFKKLASEVSNNKKTKRTTIISYFEKKFNSKSKTPLKVKGTSNIKTSMIEDTNNKNKSQTKVLKTKKTFREQKNMSALKKEKIRELSPIKKTSGNQFRIKSKNSNTSNANDANSLNIETNKKDSPGSFRLTPIQSLMIPSSVKVEKKSCVKKVLFEQR